MNSLKYLCLFLILTAQVRADEALKADPEHGVLYPEERVIDLPNDEGKPYLTLFGDPTDTQFQEIQGWFGAQGNSKLRGVKNQTHFAVITTANPMWSQRYAKTVPGTPCVRLQYHETVVFQASGQKVPMSADALYQAIAESIKSPTCPWNRKPDPKPAPDGDPEPQPLYPDTTPDTTPDTAPEESVEWWAIILCGVVGGVGGAVLGLRRAYLNEHSGE